MHFHQIKLSAIQLMRSAREQCGLDEVIDTAIEGPLARLLQSLNSEAQLSEAGAAAMERHILRVLRNRLRMQRDFRRHPEINQQRIVRPVILTGGPRSGSTKLHKMLAASGDFIVLPCWQGISPALHTGERTEDPAARIHEADERVRWFNEHAPKARLIHELSTFEVEEENLIFEHRLFGPYLAPFLRVPSYIHWYVDKEPFRDELGFLKQTLQYLQWQFHDGDARPWLLKNPVYLGYEPLLAQAFPDATFVTTHREPVSVISSGASLNTYFQHAYSDVDRRSSIGNDVLEGIAASWDKHLAARDSDPALPLLDIGYAELTRDAGQVVEKVYAHAHMDLSDGAREAMRSWDRQNSIHKHGVHKHSLEGYGVTPALIQQKFRGYVDRFGHCF